MELLNLTDGVCRGTRAKYTTPSPREGMQSRDVIRSYPCYRLFGPQNDCPLPLGVLYDSGTLPPL